MDWQELLALTVVGITAGLFVWTWRRQRRSKRTLCGSGCGCPGAGSEAPKVSVIYHARKGERPRVITRMS